MYVGCADRMSDLRGSQSFMETFGTLASNRYINSGVFPATCSQRIRRRLDVVNAIYRTAATLVGGIYEHRHTQAKHLPKLEIYFLLRAQHTVLLE